MDGVKKQVNRQVKVDKLLGVSLLLLLPPSLVRKEEGKRREEWRKGRRELPVR